MYHVVPLSLFIIFGSTWGPRRHMIGILIRFALHLANFKGIPLEGCSRSFYKATTNLLFDIALLSTKTN